MTDKKDQHMEQDPDEDAIKELVEEGCALYARGDYDDARIAFKKLILVAGHFAEESRYRNRQ